MTEQGVELLGGYRVLDMTEGGCQLCGKMLGDYGADVIKIERPGGSPSRIPPYYKDIQDPEKSLFWFAYNTNKRGITLNIEAEEGQELFKKLVAKVDFVLETFTPGYLDGLGLGYDVLSQINPRIILTSITPFGQTGPYSRFKASDITCWAMGGYMWLCGDTDRAPVRISVPEQSCLHAGAEAATASLIAHWHREMTGEGQHADVSIQQCVIWITMWSTVYWDLNRVDLRRAGVGWAHPNVNQRLVFPCKDGYVLCHVWGGGDRAVYTSSSALVKWMDEEGMAPDWLKEFDWINDFAGPVLTPELCDRVYAPIAKFYMTKTKRELFDGACERGIILAPAYSAEDLFNDDHLAARNYWIKADFPELGAVLTYPSLGVRIGATPFPIRRRPPLIGEHNEEIYCQEMGLSREKLGSLKKAGII